MLNSEKITYRHLVALCERPSLNYTFINIEHYCKIYFITNAVNNLKKVRFPTALNCQCVVAAESLVLQGNLKCLILYVHKCVYVSKVTLVQVHSILIVGIFSFIDSVSQSCTSSTSDGRRSSTAATCRSVVTAVSCAWRHRGRTRPRSWTVQARRRVDTRKTPSGFVFWRSCEGKAPFRYMGACQGRLIIRYRGLPSVHRGSCSSRPSTAPGMTHARHAATWMCTSGGRTKRSPPSGCWCGLSAAWRPRSSWC